MEDQTRYVTSADGTSIALRTLGRGRPLIYVLPAWLYSIEANWQVPQLRENFERLARRRTVVIFDQRGVGLSEREVADLTLDAKVSDLAAVVDHLGAAEVDLLASTNTGPIAIAYAARSPERVRRLVLADALARVYDSHRPPHARALWPLIESEWELFARTLTLVDFGWTEAGLRAAQANIEGQTAQTFLAAARAAGQYDVTEMLSSVRCPTLVMHLRQHPYVSLDVAKRIAASIPNARFVQLDQEEVAVPLGQEASAEIIERFLDEDDRSPNNEPPLPSGMTAILFADIADSTALTERLGDSAFRAKGRELDSSLRTIIREQAGTPIEGKLLGDGVLAVFTSARQAIEAALACAKAGDDAGLPLHLGLHAGDVIREDNNVYGGAVNVAARISGLAAPGEVLVSETVRSLARTSAGVRFEDRGEQSLKGVGEPVRVWAVREGA